MDWINDLLQFVPPLTAVGTLVSSVILLRDISKQWKRIADIRKRKVQLAYSNTLSYLMSNNAKPKVQDSLIPLKDLEIFRTMRYGEDGKWAVWPRYENKFVQYDSGKDVSKNCSQYLLVYLIQYADHESCSFLERNTFKIDEFLNNEAELFRAMELEKREDRNTEFQTLTNNLDNGVLGLLSECEELTKIDSNHISVEQLG